MRLLGCCNIRPNCVLNYQLLFVPRDHFTWLRNLFSGYMRYMFWRPWLKTLDSCLKLLIRLLLLLSSPQVYWIYKMLKDYRIKIERCEMNMEVRAGYAMWRPMLQYMPIGGWWFSGPSVPKLSAATASTLPHKRILVSMTNRSNNLYYLVFAKLTNTQLYLSKTSSSKALNMITSVVCCLIKLSIRIQRQWI